jgi:hypothetical protein
VHLPAPLLVVVAVDVTGLAAWISRDISWKDPLTSAALSCWRSRETIPLIAGKRKTKACEFILSESGPSLHFFDFDSYVFELDSSDQEQEQELNGLAASSDAQKFAAPATSRGARSSRSSFVLRCRLRKSSGGWEALTSCSMVWSQAADAIHLPFLMFKPSSSKP